MSAINLWFSGSAIESKMLAPDYKFPGIYPDMQKRPKLSKDVLWIVYQNNRVRWADDRRREPMRGK